jgi:NAD(P) transhydrogenase
VTAHAFAFVVIGSGPAGQKAAIQAAKAGASTLVIDEAARSGGACVQHGTIPSKTLRESAVAFAMLRRHSGGTIEPPPSHELKLAGLMARLDETIHAHQRVIDDQLERNGVVRWHGRARFTSATELEVRAVDGSRRTVRADHVIIATGSRPRVPTDVKIDHDHILDSDSILSISHLPLSLAVVGGGVIATEYACIFASLGVHVEIIDRAPRPLGFLDKELTDELVRAFTRQGGVYRGSRTIESITWSGSEVVTKLDDGTILRTEKLLYCLGRTANLARLDLAAAGLAANPSGYLAVDEHFRTAVPHIYAVGDVTGPPSLAATGMEQGRRAARHALGTPVTTSAELVPIGVYAIPELASVGKTQADVPGAVVGRARFSELARGQIAAIEDGLLKLVCDADGRRLLGVQIAGEGATELVHVGQIALLSGWEIDAFVENVFNFPTLAEAYRVAALDVIKQRAQLARAA